MVVVGPIGAFRGQRKRSRRPKPPLPYGSSPAPALRPSAHHTPRGTRFGLPSPIPAQGLRGPSVISRCIVDRSAAYRGGRSFGESPIRLLRTFEPGPLLGGYGPPLSRFPSARSSRSLSYSPIPSCSHPPWNTFSKRGFYPPGKSAARAAFSGLLSDPPTEQGLVRRIGGRGAPTTAYLARRSCNRRGGTMAPKWFRGQAVGRIHHAKGACRTGEHPPV